MRESTPCVILGLPGIQAERGERMQERNNFIILHDYPSPELEQAWRHCLTRVEFPCEYNSPEFFLEPLWTGKRPFAVLSIDRDGNVLGVLTGLHEGSEVVCGNPFRSQACIDRTATRAEVADSLATGLLAEADSADVATIFSWRWDPLDGLKARGFRCRQMAGCVMLDLTLGPDALFKQLDENRRRNIRYAIRKNVEVRPASSQEDIRDYHNVYLAWRRTPRKKILGQEIPLATWEGRLRLTKGRRFLLAQYDGKVIACIVLRSYPGETRCAEAWPIIITHS